MYSASSLASSDLYGAFITYINEEILLTWGMPYFTSKAEKERKQYYEDNYWEG